MIDWSAATFESQAAAASVIPLLLRALDRAPRNARLLEALGNVRLERYQFAAAASDFEAVLSIEPCSSLSRYRLAHCYNELGRHADCIALLDGKPTAGADRVEPELLHQRGVALAEVGRPEEAERSLRAALEIDPGHARAFEGLVRLLRKSERTADLIALCDGLATKGVRHARLLLEWGWALAMRGDPRACALALDPARLGQAELCSPVPMATTACFVGALADEIEEHPIILSELPRSDANRGSRRVHQLAGGARPELARALVAELQRTIDRFVASLRPAAFDPWREAAPPQARLNCWGLIQRCGEYEDWHFHPGGWLSGVCYLRLPETFSEAGEGAGCIEYGPHRGLAKAGVGPRESLRIAPREGLVLLGPSHILHRTIPFVATGRRVSFVFDVVPMSVGEGGGG